MVFSKILIKPLSIDTTEPMGVTAMIGKNPVLWMASSSPTSKETPRVGFEPTTFLDPRQFAAHATCQRLSGYDSHYTTAAFCSLWERRMFIEYKDSEHRR
jgi:hypothetical protein